MSRRRSRCEGKLGGSSSLESQPRLGDRSTVTFEHNHSTTICQVLKSLTTGASGLDATNSCRRSCQGYLKCSALGDLGQLLHPSASSKDLKKIHHISMDHSNPASFERATCYAGSIRSIEKCEMRVTTIMQTLSIHPGKLTP